jgi:hypothetical protein
MARRVSLEMYLSMATIAFIKGLGLLADPAVTGQQPGLPPERTGEIASEDSQQNGSG